jgi:hypothetical protein
MFCSARARPASGHDHNRVFETQVKAGLLPASLPFDMTRYVAGGYLERVRATVPKD